MCASVRAMRSCVGLAALALVLAGCSDDGGEGESSTGLPDCADVWVAGETLPEDYDGCMSDPDTIEAAVVMTCDDGSEFTGFDDRLYAKLGGEIGSAVPAGC